MSIRTDSVRSRRLVNSRLPCSRRLCGSLRHSVSNYCVKHAMNLAHRGHVDARSLRRSDVTALYPHVDKFLKKFARHVAIRGAVDVCKYLVVDPASVERVPGKQNKGNAKWLLWREFRRLQAPLPKLRQGHGVKEKGIRGVVVSQPKPVDGLEVLREVLAVYAHLSLADPGLLPNDREPWSAAIGRSVLYLRQARTLYAWQSSTERTAVNRQEPSGIAGKLLGQQLREGLAPILAQAVKAIEENRDEYQRAKFAMKTPILKMAPAAVAVVDHSEQDDTDRREELRRAYEVAQHGAEVQSTDVHHDEQRPLSPAERLAEYRRTHAR